MRIEPFKTLWNALAPVKATRPNDRIEIRWQRERAALSEAKQHGGLMGLALRAGAAHCKRREESEARAALRATADAQARGDLLRAVAQGNILSHGVMAHSYPAIRYDLRQPLTPFDTPAIIAERERLIHLSHDLEVQGIADTSAIRTSQRDALRAALVDACYGAGADRHDRQAYVVVGLSGAGKSTLSKNVVASTGSLAIEGDQVRDMLPEYRQNHSQYQVDAEKSGIMNRVKTRALEHGDNVVLNYVPDRVGELRTRLAEMKTYGYTVHLIHVATDLDTSMQRTQDRMERTGRLADPYSEKVLANTPAADVASVCHDASLVDTFLAVDSGQVVSWESHVAGVDPRQVVADRL